MDSAAGPYPSLPHHMHYFEEGISDRSVMQSVDAGRFDEKCFVATTRLNSF